MRSCTSQAPRASPPPTHCSHSSPGWENSGPIILNVARSTPCSGATLATFNVINPKRHSRSTPRHDGFCRPRFEHARSTQDTMDRKFTDSQKHGAHERHMEDSRQNCLLEPQQMCASPTEHTKTRWKINSRILKKTEHTSAIGRIACKIAY